jgi:diacylglycerol kinase family enzyme
VATDIRAELARWGASVETLVTESSSEWVAALDGDVERRVVLVGGDATLHGAVNSTNLRPELALVPAGRANNVAHSLGIPLAPRAAARLAVEGRARAIDLAEAVTPLHRHVTVEAVSIGFLAQARSHYQGENSARLASALAAGVEALAEFRPVRVRVTTPTSVHELSLAQLFVANLPLYGFRLHVAPDADPTDELLDVIAVDGRGRLAVPRMIGRLLRADGLGDRAVHRQRVERVRIETDASSPIIADSVGLGPGPVEVRVLPKDLRLVLP